VEDESPSQARCRRRRIVRYPGREPICGTTVQKRQMGIVPTPHLRESIRQASEIQDDAENMFSPGGRRRETDGVRIQ